MKRIVGGFLKGTLRGAASATLGSAKMAYNLLENKEKQSGAKFQTASEVNSFLRSRYNTGLVVDGIGRLRLSEADSMRMMMICAPTGSGKTTRAIINNVLLLDDCGICLTDPSMEIYNLTSGYKYHAQGYDVKILNLADPSCSIGYNPLSYANTHEEINELAHTLIRSSNAEIKGGDDIWYNESERVLSALLHCIKADPEKEHHHLANLLHLLNHFGSDGKPLFKWISTVADQHTFDTIKGLLSGNPKMLSSFVTIARSSLKLFGDPEIAAMTSRDELDFRDLRIGNKTILYLVVPHHKISLFAPLINILYSQLFAHQYHNDEYMDSNKSRSLYTLIDEAGHARIPHLDSYLATLRKQRCSVSLVFQDYSSQLTKQYGVDAAKTILSNCTNKLIYSSLDAESAQSVERLLGEVQHEYKQGGGKSWRSSKLMEASRISRMHEDQAILVSTNKEPVLLETTPCYRDKNLKRMMEYPPYPLPCKLPATVNYIDLA